MTQKELKREQMHWITRGILVSMGVRDTLYKTWTEEKDSQFDDRIVALYKRYRNMIGYLIKKRQGELFFFFLLSKTKITLKTWDGVRNLMCRKKKNLTPTKLIYKNKEKLTILRWQNR